MQIKKISLTLLIIGALSGCAIWGPSYTKPDTNAPKQWDSKNAMMQVESSADLADTAWWKSFHDKQLDELIAVALKNNTSIEQAIGNITQAAGSLQQVQLAWVPIVGAEVAQSSSSSSSSSTSYTSLSSNGYAAGLVPSYSLNIFQQLRNQELAEANLEAMKLAKDTVRLTVITQVVGSYFTLRSLDYQLIQQEQLVTDLTQLYNISKSQYDDGYISLLTLQTYLQQLEQAKAQVPVTQNNIVQTQNALRVLLNQNPGDIKRGLDITNIVLDGVIPVNMPSTVLKQRPDVLQAEALLKAANANIGVATSNFFPTIGLTGAGGVGSSSLSGLFSGAGFWTSQINATMPILNLSTFGQIKTAKGAYYTAYYNYIMTVKNAFAQVENGLTAQQKLTDSYNSQAQVYKSSQLSYEISDGRYKSGADSLATLLNSKIAMDNSAITLNTYKLQQLQSIVNLYQVLAGGYNLDNTDEQKKFDDSHDL